MGDEEKKGGYAVSTPNLLQGSLARKLVPVADGLRNLNTLFGLRPYRVRIVRTTWAGKRRGVGVEQVVNELELTPTPKLVDLNTLQEVVTAVGVTEVGQATLEEISGRYTEDQLTGVDPSGNSVGPMDSLYYEIQSFRPDGRPADRRRFALASTPFYAATKVQWIVTLDAQLDHRDRDGRPA